MAMFFLDASYLIALEIRNDQNHLAALQHWKTLRGKPLEIVTTSYVFDEVVTFFNSRNRHAKAVEVGSRLLTSHSTRIVHVDESLFSKGWQFFQQHSDKSYSLTDSISFVVMEQNCIREALTFDKHFTQAGFIRVP